MYDSIDELFEDLSGSIKGDHDIVFFRIASVKKLEFRVEFSIG